MKTKIIIILLLACPVFLFAQKQVIIMDDSNSPVNIATNKIQKEFIPAPVEFNKLKSANNKSCQMIVDFVDFPEEAKDAFLYAVSIWETQLTSEIPIRIVAKWESYTDNILAKSRPSLQYRNKPYFPEQNVYYPVALAEKLGGVELNQKQPDIECSFNSNYPWYFKTDGNTPTNKYDLVTAALHEITHGLGFTGFLHDEEGKGTFDNREQLPSIYDFYIFNKSNQQLADKNLFETPSVALHNQLISEELKIYSPAAITKSANDENWIYAPNTWKNGASIYHLNESFNSQEGLMSAYAYKGKAIHNPGKKTMEILSEIGWKSVSVFPTELKDIETPVKEMSVAVEVKADMKIDNKVTFVYSTDLFQTSDSTIFTYNTSTKKYEGNVPVNYFTGTLKYYFKMQTEDQRKYTFPANAPESVKTMKFGSDYYIPNLKHNPQQLISVNQKSIDLMAVATDNVGINKVVVEYKIDGTSQEPLVFNRVNDTTFNIGIQIPEYVSVNSKIEYRVIAEDLSNRKLTKSLPKDGFYEVKVFDNENIINEYESDFNQGNNDFITSGFSVSTQVGFDNGMLHTNHPYENSMLSNEKMNLIAQLKYPVRIQKNGKITFDEIVLVEPSDATTNNDERFMWDYVVVEASLDYGKTWMNISGAYDASANETWKNEFNNIINETSVGNGTPEMFKTRTINLTDNTGLAEGDEVIFRFRLASDNSVNGWGWSIDNLQIQKLSTDNVEEPQISAKAEISVYPNPCVSHVYVDCSNVEDTSNLEIVVTDVMGKTTFNEIWADAAFNPKKQIDMSNFEPGFYLVNVIDNYSAVVTTQKIFKN